MMWAVVVIAGTIAAGAPVAGSTARPGTTLELVLVLGGMVAFLLFALLLVALFSARPSVPSPRMFEDDDR